MKRRRRAHLWEEFGSWPQQIDQTTGPCRGLRPLRHAHRVQLASLATRADGVRHSSRERLDLETLGADLCVAGGTLTRPFRRFDDELLVARRALILVHSRCQTAALSLVDRIHHRGSANTRLPRSY